ncbi:MAG: hypothetical protein A3D92_13180 [Bacteroidetes bacterium RIFCSPHIGHO2_02_FULL_44_7]|nr:MAG: hypothetical protein A3D92_13180 [Bacteroidetes bacterium RIFCSPHIGHO2_02_FULL_44_7]
MSNQKIIALNRFIVDFGGTTVGFQEVSGLEQKTEIISYEDGSFINGAAPYKYPGKTKYSESITLKRGYFKGDTEMQDWLEAIRSDDTARRNITITLLDESQNPMIVWNVMNVWPSEIGGLTLGAEKSEAAIEHITFAHEGYIMNLMP